MQSMVKVGEDGQQNLQGPHKVSLCKNISRGWESPKFLCFKVQEDSRVRF